MMLAALSVSRILTSNSSTTSSTTSTSSAPRSIFRFFGGKKSASQ